MYAFNDAVDHYALAPVARGYRRYMPGFVRTGIRNFFSNLEEPNTILNDLLQGKFYTASQDFLRFAVNSVWGLAGVLDVATASGMAKNEEDFGQTFAVWGIGDGPYLVLPILGPSGLRDGVGLVGDYFAVDPLSDLHTKEWLAVQTVKAIDTRAGLTGLDDVLAMQLDPYVFIRESYRQRRDFLIHDGAPPPDDGLLEDVLFDDTGDEPAPPAE